MDAEISKAEREWEKKHARELEKDRQKAAQDKARADARWRAKHGDKKRPGSDDDDGADDAAAADAGPKLATVVRDADDAVPRDQSVIVRQMRVVTALKAQPRRRFYEPQQIYALTLAAERVSGGVDVTAPDLAAALARHPMLRVGARGEIQYVPPHHAGSIDELKELLRDSPCGVGREDGNNMYPCVVRKSLGGVAGKKEKN
jgi:hypothetical protein